MPELADVGSSTMLFQQPLNPIGQAYLIEDASIKNGNFSPLKVQILGSGRSNLLSIYPRWPIILEKAGPEGLEPSTNCSAGSHSIQAELWAQHLFLTTTLPTTTTTAVTATFPSSIYLN